MGGTATNVDKKQEDRDVHSHVAVRRALGRVSRDLLHANCDARSIRECRAAAGRQRIGSTVGLQPARRRNGDRVAGRKGVVVVAFLASVHLPLASHPWRCRTLITQNASTLLDTRNVAQPQQLGNNY